MLEQRFYYTIAKNSRFVGKLNNCRLEPNLNIMSTKLSALGCNCKRVVMWSSAECITRNSLRDE